MAAIIIGYLSQRDSMAHDVFISYAAENKTTADAVCAGLESAKIRCWIAPRDVPHGMSWPAAITAAIRECGLMVLIFTESSNSSVEVLKEVTLASRYRKAIVPFRTEPVEPGLDLEYHLATPHWLDALTPPLEAHVRSLVASAFRLLGKGGDFVASDKASDTPAPVPPPPRIEPGSSFVRTGAITAGLVWFTTAWGRVHSCTNALELFQLSRGLESRGDPTATYNLGVCYHEGKGVAFKDYAEAERWYRKAVERGYSTAASNLACLLIDPDIGRNDPAEAVRLLRPAADKGDFASQYNLARMLDLGLGVEANKNEAKRLYGLVANEGGSAAWNNLGVLMAEAGEKSDAMRCFRQGAELGSVDAMYNLAWNGENGLIGAKDQSEAVKWYRLGAAKGHERSKVALARLNAK